MPKHRKVLKRLIEQMFRYLPLLIFVLAANVASQTFYGSSDLRTFRDGRDKEFRNREESPLIDTDFANFRGLRYFENDSSFRVRAVFVKTLGGSLFLMPTSNGVPKKFLKFGELWFKLNGVEQKLNVYQLDPELLRKVPEYADLLFVPFKDTTNGNETYGVGRYVDIKMPKSERVTLDFNLAYNPNCAYGNDKYSCPIPPKENHLKVAVRAGEKSFRKANLQAGEIK